MTSRGCLPAFVKLNIRFFHAGQVHLVEIAINWYFPPIPLDSGETWGPRNEGNVRFVARIPGMDAAKNAAQPANFPGAESSWFCGRMEANR